MTTAAKFPLEGGCACSHIRYRIETNPLIVHCCHCHWCQRETGTAFALNAVIESPHVTLLGPSPELIQTPSESGRGQLIARCPTCHVAVWSNYSVGPFVRFVRVGTLDMPGEVKPDIHIYTSSKLPWVVLPEGARSFDESYEIESVWSKESLERRKVLLPEVERWMAERRAEGGN